MRKWKAEVLMLRNIPGDLQVEVGFDPGSGAANHTIQGAIFHCIAGHIEDLETENMRLKAQLFDLMDSAQQRLTQK